MEVKTEIKKQERNIVNNILLYFSSFGAASVSVSLIILLLSILLRAFSIDIAIAALAWIFLFLFPAELSFAYFFIRRALRMNDGFNPFHGLIFGYGTFSVLSFLVILLTDNFQSTVWFVPILAILTLSIFFSYPLISRFSYLFGRSGKGEDHKLIERTGSSDRASDLRKKVEEPESTRPILLIRAPENDKEKNKASKR